MGENRENYIDEIVQKILSDYDGDKNIDAFNIYNKPDKDEVRDILFKLIRIVYPGYFKERAYKIYNLKNSLAVTIEDIYYHLHRQIELHLKQAKTKPLLMMKRKRLKVMKSVMPFLKDFRQ